MGKEKLTVALIRLRNVLGVESLDVRPGALTVIEGANGTGKTSVIEALKNVVQGGTDATLVHAGADAAEVVLLLSDGTEIAKRTPRSGVATLSVTQPGGHAVTKPKSFVEGLLDELAFNPIEFLTAPPKRRVEYLLEAMPLSVSGDDLAEALGDAADAPPNANGHALQVIERYHDSVYDERTGVNRAAKEKRNSEKELRASLPREAAQEVSVDELRERREQLREEGLAAVQRLTADRDERVEAVRAELLRKIDELRAEAEERVAQIRAEAEAAVETERANRIPQIQQLDSEIGAAMRANEDAALHANTRRMVERAAQEAAALEERSASLSAALDRLEALKVRLLQQLPLKGVEIRGGELYHDGVPWDRVNTAERVKVALSLAQLRAADARLPLVCVDGLECLDAPTFDTFRRLAPKAGLQLIVTRVGEGPLQVDEIPAAA